MGAFDVGMIFFTEMKSILSLATEHMMNLLITINPFNRAQSPNGRHLCEASIRKKHGKERMQRILHLGSSDDPSVVCLFCRFSYVVFSGADGSVGNRHSYGKDRENDGFVR